MFRRGSSIETYGRRIAWLPVLVLILCGVASERDARAQASSTTYNETLPLSATVANTCTGEGVALSGQIHIVTHTSFDAAGGSHLDIHMNFEDVTGTGQTSNVSYRGVSSNQHTFNSALPQSETTFVSDVRLISQGPNSNFLAHITIHMTINSNGETTSDVQNVTIECRG